MALFHSTTKVISRSKGRSSVAAAAYRAGECLEDRRQGLTHDYTRKEGCEYSEIVLPETAPERYKDRSTLWNEVEHKENRKDAQTAREVELALPVEFSRTEQIRLVQEYVRSNFVDCGMIADFSIHAGHGHERSREHAQVSNIESENPHVHIMLTMREVTAAGFGNKNREWNNNANIIEWRKDWAERCNREYEKKRLDLRIDHRSYTEQGIEKEPTVHMGAAFKLEQRGVETERGNINREVVHKNMDYQKGFEEVQQEVSSLKRQFEAEQQTKDIQQSEKLKEEKQPEKAEIVAERLHKLRQEYVSEEIIMERRLEKGRGLNSEKKRLQNKSEYIQAKKDTVVQCAKEVERLKAERNELGLFSGKEKKAIDEKINRTEDKKERNHADLEAECKGQTPQEALNQLSQRTREIEKVLADLPRNNKLREEQEVRKEAYLIEKEKAMYHPEYRRIAAMEKNLDDRKEYSKKSVREEIAWAKASAELNNKSAAMEREFGHERRFERTRGFEIGGR